MVIIKQGCYSYYFKDHIDLQDMSIEDQEIVELVNQIEELEKKLYSHPLHKVCHASFVAMQLKKKNS